MVRNNATTFAVRTMEQGTLDADDTMLRTMLRSMAFGAGIRHVVCTLAMALVVSWGVAALIAFWPAVFVGPMFGGLGALARRPTAAPLAPVVNLARSETVAWRRAA